MNTKQLEYVLVFSRESSFSKAAITLNIITQASEFSPTKHSFDEMSSYAVSDMNIYQE